MRDSKSYCAILWGNNNRKPIARLFFAKSRMNVSIFSPDGEKKVQLEKISDLYKHKAELHAAIKQYLPLQDAA